jgi:hypothetical protein
LLMFRRLATAPRLRLCLNSAYLGKDTHSIFSRRFLNPLLTSHHRRLTTYKNSGDLARSPPDNKRKVSWLGDLAPVSTRALPANAILQRYTTFCVIFEERDELHHRHRVPIRWLSLMPLLTTRFSFPTFPIAYSGVCQLSAPLLHPSPASLFVPQFSHNPTPRFTFHHTPRQPVRRRFEAAIQFKENQKVQQIRIKVC